MKVLTHRFRFRGLFVMVGLVMAFASAKAKWEDESAGSLLLRDFSAKEMGADGMRWTVLPDKSGRLFVGGAELQVFDGQEWKYFPIPNAYELRSMVLGEGGRLWTGASNEVGYFDEETSGDFRYHSLLSYLPQEERALADVWGCAVVGRSVYFICSDRLLRWDGMHFQVTHFGGERRLYPFRVGHEVWFHHIGSGLYRLTEEGQVLEIDAAKLPSAGIMGLVKDSDGLLLVSTAGFFRPGIPAVRQYSEELNQYLITNRLSSFSVLPDGNYAIGTLDGGIGIANSKGELLRVFDTSNGLPTRTIFSIAADDYGFAWCATPKGIFRFESAGHVTLFDQQNGLKGQAVMALDGTKDSLYALTLEGVFALKSSARKGASFERIPLAPQTYSSLLFTRQGLLLPRLKGVDYFDGTSLKSVVSHAGEMVFFVEPSLIDRSSYYLAEGSGFGKLTFHLDGTFEHQKIAELPDTPKSLHEDASGLLWVGTSKGAFRYDPVSQRLSPVLDPVSGKTLQDQIVIVGNNQGVVLFHDNGAFQISPDGSNLKGVEGLPSGQWIAAQSEPGGNNFVVAFRRQNQSTLFTQGLAVVSVDQAGRAHWRELDVPSLANVGFIRTLKFIHENDRSILWIGGSEGLSRLDYEKITAVERPPAPIIHFDAARSSVSLKEDAYTFPFKGHKIGLKVYAGDYARSKEWVFQTRTDNKSEWSTPSPQRIFDFTNLSEGPFRFEIRAINFAGLVSEPAFFSFSILPPWYRSSWAYGSYVLVGGLAGLGLIRFRERRMRFRTRELEELVASRTGELVKANAAKDEFLANVSHEIRNPMNGVIGIAEAFDIEELGPESRRKFGILKECASHLSSLMEDLLDLSRLEADAVELESNSFNLSELAESLVAITASESAKRGIPVEVAISPAVPRWLIGDARRIKQILLNFVSNALKFSNRGQVCITIWNKGGESSRPELVFAVADDGPGISVEEQEKLFMRFERGAAAQAKHVPGTGIGLALSRGLAEKMGGRIWVESEPGKGSCFYFSASFAQSEPASRVTPSIAQHPRPNRIFALVVDDEEYNRVALTGLLEGFDFIVLEAENAQKALTCTRQQAFDFIFVDLALGDSSGLEVARAIRLLPNQSRHAVIFATTAYNSADKRAHCLNAGMDGFLTKPVTMERLRQVLSAVSTPGENVAPVSDANVAIDPLINLRLLAKRKRVALADELTLFLDELEVERKRLLAALQREEPREAGHYAHLLHGRCAFINERELERALRRTEAAAATGRWDEARLFAQEIEQQLAALRIKLTSVRMSTT